MRICNKCKIQKDWSEFGWRNKQQQVRHYTCKNCVKETSLAHYSNNKQKYINRALNVTKVATDYVKELRQRSKCSICPESAPECLDFHHLESQEKDNAVSMMLHLGIERVQREINKCIILCANCHRKIHSGRITLDT